ncbi:MAG: NADH-quinone oxidoreductase subunit C [Candidatus Marinimicrobia bacterium]|nr:NADH-quinone oxidoreductase subunit C [Candidatus Neomarinimicrobiota bacterium]
MQPDDILKILQQIEFSAPEVKDPTLEGSTEEAVAEGDIVEESVSDKVEESDRLLFDEDSQSIMVDYSIWLDVAKELKGNKDLNFDYLMCIASYDLGSDRLGLAYNLYSNHLKHSLEVKIEFESSVEVPSVASVWRTADWHEREAYDMMGTLFSGHPDMRRILLASDWEGHPLRKDYKEPDYYRGVPVPKDKTAWE